MLPGVTVYVSSTALTAPRTTTSDDSGRYQFNALPVGDYELTFRLVEFTAATHPRVSVAANELTTVNGVMAPEP